MKMTHELYDKFRLCPEGSIVLVEDVEFYAFWDWDHQPEEGSVYAPSEHYVPEETNVYLRGLLTGIRHNGTLMECTHEITDRLNQKTIDNILEQLEDELNERKR